MNGRRPLSAQRNSGGRPGRGASSHGTFPSAMRELHLRTKVDGGSNAREEDQGPAAPRRDAGGGSHRRERKWPLPQGRSKGPGGLRWHVRGVSWRVGCVKGGPGRGAIRDGPSALLCAHGPRADRPANERRGCRGLRSPRSDTVVRAAPRAGIRVACAARFACRRLDHGQGEAHCPPSGRLITLVMKVRDETGHVIEAQPETNASRSFVGTGGGANRQPIHRTTRAVLRPPHVG